MKAKGNFIFNIIMAAVATLLIVYLYPQPEANHYKYMEGHPWNYSKLIAPFDIPIRPDSATITAVRDSLDKTFIPIFTRDEDADDNIITALMSQWAHDDTEDAPTELEDKLRRKTISIIRAAYQGDVIDDTYAIKIKNKELPKIKLQVDNTISHYPTTHITSPSRIIAKMAEQLGIDTVAANEWLKVNNIDDMLEPNLVFNEETSARLYQNEIERAAAVKGVIMQGQTLVDKGQIISPQDYTNLKTYEAMVDDQFASNTRSKWIVLLGQFLFVGLLFTCLLGFLQYSSPHVWNDRKKMIFIMLLIFIFFIICGTLTININNGEYLTPFAIVPILLIVFFDYITAIFVSVIAVVLCSGIVMFPLEFIYVQLLAIVAAIFSLRDVSRRSDLLRTSIFVLIAYVAGYFTVTVVHNGSFADFQWRMVIFLAISAAISSMAYILMAVVERLFGFVSVLTLIELADANNPILREMSQECPGTFQHSMAVGNLASDAALKIGANEQLVRAGAMYHDIGKMSNPNFFTENQRGVNPHDVLAPEQSARIITGHVADGLERAEKAGLPMMIKDFISQHHGKGKAKFFYFNYCKAHPNQDVDPTPFTYPGPNPQSRETSLLMMADSVEAASRSLKEHTPEAIRALVDKIIDSQIAEGLHDESTLEFRDIKIIKDAFVRRLMTMYHSRIVYPDDPNSKKQ